MTTDATPEPTLMAAADWYDDPTGRFLRRYWDGAQWTAHVQRADGGVDADPLAPAADTGAAAVAASVAASDVVPVDVVPVDVVPVDVVPVDVAIDEVPVDVVPVDVAIDEVSPVAAVSPVDEATPEELAPVVSEPVGETGPRIVEEAVVEAPAPAAEPTPIALPTSFEDTVVAPAPVAAGFPEPQPVTPGPVAPQPRPVSPYAARVVTSEPAPTLFPTASGPSPSPVGPVAPGPVTGPGPVGPQPTAPTPTAPTPTPLAPSPGPIAAMPTPSAEPAAAMPAPTPEPAAPAPTSVLAPAPAVAPPPPAADEARVVASFPPLEPAPTPVAAAAPATDDNDTSPLEALRNAAKPLGDLLSRVGRPDHEEPGPSPTWAPDPTGRHDSRYWDGTAWTDRVQRFDGSESADPYTDADHAAIRAADAEPSGLDGLLAAAKPLAGLADRLVGTKPVEERLGGKPGWQVDPTGRNESRYWDGAAWTDRVQRFDGTEGVDAYTESDKAPHESPTAFPKWSAFRRKGR